MNKKEYYGPHFEQDDFIKNCPNYPFRPTILPAVDRIIAMGDIHGDLSVAIQMFKLAKLIDNEFNWVANPKNTIVVQVGDQVDSCRPTPNNDCRRTPTKYDKWYDMDVISFFDKMNEKAMKYGGAVYSLLGNHELMNVMGDLSYVSYKSSNNFKYTHNNKTYEGVQGRIEAFELGGPVSNHMGCTRNSVMIIGSNIFAHAGVLPKLASLLEGYVMNEKDKLRYLNKIVRDWLMKKITENNSVMDGILRNSDSSPFWNRIYGNVRQNQKLESCPKDLLNTIETFKIGQVIVGHTPQMNYNTNGEGIHGTCADNNGVNRLFKIDGGFSDAFKVFEDNGKIQVLEILNDSTFNILTGKKKYQ